MDETLKEELRQLADNWLAYHRVLRASAKELLNEKDYFGAVEAAIKADFLFPLILDVRQLLEH